MLPRAFVKGPTAKVRSEPKKNSPMVGGLNRGTVVKILDQDCGWSLVEWRQKYSDAVVGWMNNIDLEPLKDYDEKEGAGSICLCLIGMAILCAVVLIGRFSNGK